MQKDTVRPLTRQIINSDPFKPFYQLHQADVFLANHQYQPNLQPPRNTYPLSFQPAPVQTQANYGSLPQNILDQIRSCVSSAAPIFILPGGCHRQTGASNLNEGVAQHSTGQSTNVNPFASFHCPPSFYPYPVPMPVFEPFGVQTRGKDGSRGCFSCCQRKQRGLDGKEYAVGCCCDVHEQEEHRCTATNGDTICSKRDCPVSISLQALASQFLSLPGIISCAVTRLILRKIPGSNITSSTEDTMDKAIKCLETLNKEQLLAECRNSQHANALINLHMTTNPPVNIIPLLTLLQLKVNVLKAQVENLINKKVTECQGFGFEVSIFVSCFNAVFLNFLLIFLNFLGIVSEIASPFVCLQTRLSQFLLLLSIRLVFNDSFVIKFCKDISSSLQRPYFTNVSGEFKSYRPNSLGAFYK